MQLFNRWLERFALAILLVGGAGMLAAMFLGTGDVVGTQFFGWPVPGAKEITESTMVLIVFGALAYAQIRRAHIRVELIYAHVGPRLQALMDVFTDAAALTFFGLMLWQAKMEAEYSYQINERTVGLIRFPLYPARIILAAGTGLLVLRLVLDLIIDTKRTFTGEPPEQVGPSLPELGSGGRE